MKLEYLYIHGYKNLDSFEVYFDKDVSLLALAGKNGSGKSNVLEAIARIFSTVYAYEEMPDFTFDIGYAIHGDLVTITNKSSALVIVKNDKVIPWTKRRSVLPITLFLYYAGETERFKSISDKAIDKDFDKSVKNGAAPSYKAISYLSVNDFGLSMLVNRCFNLDVSNTINNILGIEAISKKCAIHLKRPIWGKRGTADNFWNAKGYIEEILNFLKANGACRITSREAAIITLPDCEYIRDDLLGPEGLFKSLKILQQAGILDHIEIDVIKEGVTFDCNELSEGEKQLANFISIVSFTRSYSALFLMDEFDSYLHPSWQRVFAGLVYQQDIAGQIVFTTHSPLTLSQMKNNNVFLLNNGKIFESGLDPYNRNVSEIMEELMDVPLRPEHIMNMLNNFNKYIATKNIAAAKKIRQDLSVLLSADDPFFITADLSIARIERQ